MARKKLKSTLKSSSTKLPKSRITKDPEEKPRKIREKKQDDKPVHKKRLPAKPDDKLTIFDPEYQRIKRKQAAKKAVETRKKNEAAMPPEVLKQKRAEAARKAKETRRNKEAALPQKEREELRQKRAEQARKNFSKKSNTDKNQYGKHEAYSDSDYASYTDEALRQIEEFIAEFEHFQAKASEFAKYSSGLKFVRTANARAEWTLRVRDLYNFRIAEIGRDALAKIVGESGEDIATCIYGIKYASSEEQVAYFGRRLISAMIGRALSMQEASDLDEILEANTTYDMGDDEGEY